MKPNAGKQAIALLAALVSAAALTLTAGCSTHQARGVTPSGFLGDYSQLRKGTGDEAKLVYFKPNVDWAKYDKILMDPIKVYCTPERSWWRDAKPEQVKALVDYFDASIRKSLEDDLTFVDKPGPGVLHFRVAITEAGSGNVPLDVVSSIVPIGLAISTLKRGVANKATGVGEAGAELEITDSQTGERLAAMVDARIGDKFTGKFDKFDQWRGPKAAFDYWAMRMHVRLLELQGTQATQAKEAK